MEYLKDIITILFGATGVIGMLAYYPTIKDLYFHKKKSANSTSYLIWTITGGIGFLYALIVLSDTLLRIVAGINFVCCLTILFLSINLHKK